MIFNFIIQDTAYDLEIRREFPWFSFVLRDKGSRSPALVLNISVKGNELYIGDIYISETSRRSNNLGTAVLSLAIQLAHRKGYKRMYGYCSSGEDNPVHNFYLRLGFEIYPENGLLNLRLNDSI